MLKNLKCLNFCNRPSPSGTVKIYPNFLKVGVNVRVAPLNGSLIL